MPNTNEFDITLVMEWPTHENGEALRRNTTGFGTIKSLLTKGSDNKPLKINVFLYVFLMSAKNLDLFLKVNSEPVKDDVQEICEKMDALARLEREGVKPEDDSLLSTYKSIRLIAARPSARDEQRTLATLLFSGPSSPEQIQADLGINKGLAERVLRALSPLVEQSKANQNQFVLRSDSNSIAIALYLLQYTLGLDPLNILQSHLATLNKE